MVTAVARYSNHTRPPLTETFLRSAGEKGEPNETSVVGTGDKSEIREKLKSVAAAEPVRVHSLSVPNNAKTIKTIRVRRKIVKNQKEEQPARSGVPLSLTAKTTSPKRT